MTFPTFQRHGSLLSIVVLAFLLCPASAPAAAKKDKPSSPLSDELELPPSVMEPDAFDKETSYKESAPELAAPMTPSDNKVDVAADAPLTLPQKPESKEVVPNDVEDILDNPSRSIDEYERVRKDRLHKTSIMQYSFNLTLEPAAFGKIDLRAPTKHGSDQINPGLLGILLGFDYSVFRQAGIAMAGIEGGFYSSTQTDPYSGLMFGFMSLRPNVRYEAAFLPKQWVVPTVGAGLEMLRYAYTFQNAHVGGFKTMPRIDIGALFFLNIIEPNSAAEMDSNWGVRKTYLSAYYSISNDSSRRDFNLSENTWRLGFRFEH